MNSVLARVRGVPIWGDGKRLWYEDGMTVDADGANGQSSLPCYGPNDTGLDHTAYAGHPGNWWGVVVDANGRPLVQSGLAPEQPVEGFYISTTSYQRKGFGINDVRRYLDAATIPFIVVPGFLRSAVKPIVLGCRARVTYRDRPLDCLVGDFGSSGHLGEASMAVLKHFKLNSNPRTGGTNSPDFFYEVFPGEQVTIDGETFDLIPA